MTRPYSRTWWCAMAAITVATPFVIAMQPAQADEWATKDKGQHAQAGALIGGIAAAASKSPAMGCLIAGAAGISKELWDANHPGHEASLKDFAVTTLAGCLTAKVTGLVVGPNRIVFKREF